LDLHFSLTLCRSWAECFLYRFFHFRSPAIQRFLDKLSVPACFP
jgi:hypothetical protein